MAQTNSSGNETSLKQLFQSMIPGGPELMEGKVIQINPLKIQMTNDEKLIINERITIVPWHLTDYKTRATARWTERWIAGRKTMVPMPTR